MKNKNENLKNKKRKNSFINIKIEPNLKINPKRSNIKKNISIHYYNSESNSIGINSINNYISRNSTKLKSYSQDTYNNKTGLSENDKRKIKSITKVFRINKVLTERLLKKEKTLALNSVNNSNYSFLISQNEGKKLKNKNTKLYFRNRYNDYSSYMINKFNNRTFGILDPPNNKPIYSTNLNYFRHQLINNFTERNNNMEYEKKRYNDAMMISEINDKKNLKNAFDLEKKFYENKYNFMTEINLNLLNKIKQLNGASRTSYLSRNKSLMIAESDPKNKTPIIKNSEKNLDISNLKLLYDIRKLSPAKPRKSPINLNSYNNYIKLNQSNIKEKNDDTTEDEKSLSKVKKEHYYKEQKKIRQRSKDHVNSIYEINDYPYVKFDPAYIIKNGYIQRHNLSRAIKINTINKYGYNLEDDYLLVHNPKKLKEEIMKVQIECNKINYKAIYNYSFLRKNLKLETVRKFNSIKDSKFGCPI